MDFSFTPEEQELQQRVRRIAAEEIAPCEGTSEVQRQTVARPLLRE